MIRNAQPLLNNAYKALSASFRTLMLQEHHGMAVLRGENIKVPPFGVAKTAEEAKVEAERIGGKDYVIKAQVLAGGRGKGRFDSGLQGGVHIVFTWVFDFYPTLTMDLLVLHHCSDLKKQRRRLS
ncbi:ATP-grasp domain protein [Ancylostoma caninum]|uniref:ATP-grasp domain protein n=1 Tax=Ancylostoma caninum TaxID=29170 RepID=A0A368G349_ANCCA|nr:ATP-grasp domain protein [Ancylostoma caninum]